MEQRFCSLCPCAFSVLIFCKPTCPVDSMLLQSFYVDNSGGCCSDFKIRQSFILTQLLATISCREDRFSTIKLNNPCTLLSGSALQLLIILLKELTETGSAEIEMPLSKFLALRNLRDKKFARKQLLADLAVIEAIQFEYRPSNKTDKVYTAKISNGCGYIKNSILHFKFDNSFFPIVPAKQYMWLPYDILQTQKNENIAARMLLTWRICQHKRMNLDRTNANTISVKSLLNCCPVPSPEELGKAGQLNKRIVEPFEKALDNCGCFSWQYGVNQTETYTDFAQSKVEIHWHTDPYADSTGLKAAKAKQRVKSRKKGSGG